MRNIKTFILTGFIAAFVIAILPSRPAAAACNNVSSFGSVTYSISDISNIKDRVVWVRMQSPDESSRVTVEVNGSDCFEVGGYEQKPSEWSWQTSRKDSQIVSLSLDQNKDNILKVIGTQDNVKIDKIMVTGLDCVPQGIGDNCSNGESFHEQSSAEYVILASPKNSVNGKVVLSDSPKLQGDSLREVRYLVNGTAVQISNSAEPFDTTLLPNGEHKVYVITEVKDKEPIKEAISIKVDNNEDAFTGIFRWIRLNGKLTIMIFSILLTIIIAFVGLFIARERYKAKRQRKFKGIDFK